MAHRLAGETVESARRVDSQNRYTVGDLWRLVGTIRAGAKGAIDDKIDRRQHLRIGGNNLDVNAPAAQDAGRHHGIGAVISRTSDRDHSPAVYAAQHLTSDARNMPRGPSDQLVESFQCIGVDLPHLSRSDDWNHE